MMNKRLDENTVRYCLYPKLDANDENNFQIYLNDCLTKLANYLTDYYWYYTSFNLQYVDKDSSSSKGMQSINKTMINKNAFIID